MADPLGGNRKFSAGQHLGIGAGSKFHVIQDNLLAQVIVFKKGGGLPRRKSHSLQYPDEHDTLLQITQNDMHAQAFAFVTTWLK